MRKITLERPWTYRTPQKTIHYPSGEHEVFAYIAEKAEGEGVIQGSEEPDDPLDDSIPDLRDQVAGIEDPAEIDRLITAERGGKTRSGALKVLEARKAELTG